MPDTTHDTGKDSVCATCGGTGEGDYHQPCATCKGHGLVAILATHDTLREQVARTLSPFVDAVSAHEYAQADAVLVVFAGRERELRERIEAIRAEYEPDGDGNRWLHDGEVLAVFDA